MPGHAGLGQDCRDRQGHCACVRWGATKIIGVDRAGAVHDAPEGSSAMRRWLVENTNADKRSGTLKEVLVGADVFIGVSAPNILDGNDISRMADRAVVFG